MKRIEVPYFQQDTDYTCGPTSMQMVLAYYGVKYSEKDLTKVLKTSIDTGTCILQMLETSVDLGYHCYIDDNANYEEIVYLLSLKIPPIVRFIEPDEDEDHYGVVVAASDTEIEIHDPWNGPHQIYKKEDFVERWICSAYRKADHWLMAISPEPIVLGQQFHPHE